MKKIFFISFIFIYLLFSAFSGSLYTEQELYDRQNLISSIRRVGEPFIQDGYIVFTAKEEYRFVGISFDFEQYKKIHALERLPFFDMDYEPLDSVLFYLCKIPQNTKRIQYRLIIDGLWTNDPLNSAIRIDETTQMKLSYVDLPYEAPVITKKTEDGFVRFIYEGEPGQTISLSGSFTGWDPYIYQMEETKQGFYELRLHLPPGTHYYTYYKGFTSFVDEKNPERAYTEEGRVASVLRLN